jgi:hypothetical protein
VPCGISLAKQEHFGDFAKTSTAKHANNRVYPEPSSEIAPHNEGALPQEIHAHQSPNGVIPGLGAREEDVGGGADERFSQSPSTSGNSGACMRGRGAGLVLSIMVGEGGGELGQDEWRRPRAEEDVLSCQSVSFATPSMVLFDHTNPATARPLSGFKTRDSALASTDSALASTEALPWTDALDRYLRAHSNSDSANCAHVPWGGDRGDRGSSASAVSARSARGARHDACSHPPAWQSLQRTPTATARVDKSGKCLPNVTPGWLVLKYKY